MIGGIMNRFQSEDVRVLKLAKVFNGNLIPEEEEAGTQPVGFQNIVVRR